MILRSLLVKLGLKTDEASFAKGELAAKGVEVGLEKLVEWAKEAVEGFKETIKQTIEYGDAINKAAQSTGIGRDALQELQYAAAQSDISAEGLNSAMGRLSRSMREAHEGSKEQAAAFQKLGIKVTDAHGKLRDMDDVLTDVAGKFEKLPDGTDKLAASMQIFGRGLGAQMIPFLNKGAAGLEDMRKEAEQLGLVMSDEDVKAAEDLKDTLRQITAVTKGLWRSAIAPLLPALNDLAKRFLEWRKANGAIMKQRITQYIGYVITAVGKLAGAFEFLVRNGEVVKVALVGVIATLALLNTASEAAALKIAARWALAAAPFVALAGIVTGIFLLFDDLAVYQKEKTDPKHFHSAFGMFQKQLADWMKPADKDTWFVAAIKDFVRLLNEAMELIDEFYEYTGRTNPRKADQLAGVTKQAIQQRADAITEKTARGRVAAGQPLTEVEKAALGRSGVSPEAFVDKYGAKGPLAAPTVSEATSAPGAWAPYAPNLGGGGTTNLVQTQISVTQQPGEDGDALSQRLGKMIQDHWDGKLEEAAASGATD